MALRQNSRLIETPNYDGEDDVGKFTIKLHHGGALLYSPFTRYVGGSINYYDYVSSRNLSINTLREFVGACRPLCDVNRTKFFAKLSDSLVNGSKLISKESDIGWVVKRQKDGEVDLYVQHGDLEDMLRAEVVNGEIRQDDVGDIEEDEMNIGSTFMESVEGVGIDVIGIEGDNSDDSKYDNDELVDEDYIMDEDDILFDTNVDKDAEIDGTTFNHSTLFSTGVHEQINAADGEDDLMSDYEGMHNDERSSDIEVDAAGLDKYPKFNVKYDSRNPKFLIGMLFGSRKELKQAIDTYNIKDSRAIKYVKNEKSRLRVVCKDSDCKWFMYAKRISGETGLQIRKWHLEHTCIPVFDNKSLTSTWLARHYVKKFRNSPAYKSADFRKEMGLKLGQHISKWMAWRAKVCALQNIYGDETKQYKRIWDFCAEIVETNPGTKCYVKTVFNEKEQPVVQRWYLCWTACRDGFNSGCRKLIGVDGCHLKTRFGGQLLVAVGVDPNNNIFPIAFAIVEVENKDSWKWFLSHLAEDVSIPRGPVEDEIAQYEWTFMSDKQKGLIEAFKNVLPRISHRFCVRHLHENFKRAGFKAQSYKDALWGAATATTIHSFKLKMEEMKSLDTSAYEWFSDKDASQWSRSYFTISSKCDVLLNNMCEVFNSFILEARDKPILTLVAMVKDLIMVRMQVNRDKAAKWQRKLCPKPRLKLIQNVKDASACMPTKSDRTHFQVYSGSTTNQCVVDLDKRQCTCRKWKLNGIPCKHACAAIRLNREDVEDYVDECYYINTFKKVYRHAIVPISGLDFWPQTGRIGPLPPNIKNMKAGRPTRLRRVNPIEAEGNGKNSQCKVRKYLCAICKEQGHNSRTCKKKKTSSTAGVEENIGGQPSQESFSTPYPWPSQQDSTAFAQETVTTVPNYVPIHRRAVVIRAPAPMIGTTLFNRTPFEPPTRSRTTSQTVFINDGQKFVSMNNLQK